MTEPLLLYSTSSRLAYQIAQRYYKDVHYAWCSPVFDGRAASRFVASVPPTSSPCEIYWNLNEEARRGDRHSPRISNARAGIVLGAHSKRNAGIIDDETVADIIASVDLASPWEFRPLMFIMPYGRVRQLITKVPVQKRAHPLSLECLIVALPGRLFDVIELSATGAAV
jgi:hypothetical protein